MKGKIVRIITVKTKRNCQIENEIIFGDWNLWCIINSYNNASFLLFLHQSSDRLVTQCSITVSYFWRLLAPTSEKIGMNISMMAFLVMGFWFPEQRASRMTPAVPVPNQGCRINSTLHRLDTCLYTHPHFHPVMDTLRDADRCKCAPVQMYLLHR